MSGKYWLFLLFSAVLFTGCSFLQGHLPESQPPGWLADGFDFPVGDRDGRGWEVTGYDFLQWSSASQTWHPGEDWNIPKAGDGDLGEPVYSVANGEVVFSGWNTALGNVILIKHALSENEFVWSQYAHLDRRDVATGDLVYRRQMIGTVGKGPNNRFSAHLHFEMRKEDLPANAWPRTNGQAWPQAKVTQFWLHPTKFIWENRPQ
ncbi:MAG TPA: M23 family metallopeptidase [Firmicutes bacterium]|nr:M23 family metallopeptidase [Bacillota bacterium]